jgi:hypothetical protein
MPVCKESGIEFDFNVAKQVHAHDMKCQCTGKYGRDDNSLWPGVDFRIEDAEGWLWLEVKNWRVSARNSYTRKMRSKAFAGEMREKLLGTAAFLASRKKPDAFPSPLTLVFLFQPPPSADPGLQGIAYQLIREQIHSALTPLNISFVVVDIARWNQKFPDYPAKQI